MSTVLNEQSLEECIQAITEMVDSDTLSIRPNKLIVRADMYRLALKVLRGRGWYYRNTPRWKYLVRRGARHV
jgi:hypothetical protein